MILEPSALRQHCQISVYKRQFLSIIFVPQIKKLRMYAGQELVKGQEIVQRFGNYSLLNLLEVTAQKMKFFIMYFSSKCNQLQSFL